MPESIRAANERLRSRPWRGGFLAAFVLASLLNLCSAPVRAETKLGATLVGTMHRALATLRDGKVARISPLIPGIDLAGEVVASHDPDLPVGRAVLAHGYELGVSRQVDLTGQLHSEPSHW